MIRYLRQKAPRLVSASFPQSVIEFQIYFTSLTVFTLAPLSAEPLALRRRYFTGVSKVSLKDYLSL